MLHTRKLIPPLTLCEPQGSTVHAWDFKQKKNLVIAFLDVDCALCGQLIRTLIEHAVCLDEKEAVVLLAFIKEPASSLTNSLPSGIIAGVDVDSRGALAFLGEDGPPMQELRRRAVFVSDRWAEAMKDGAFDVIDILCELPKAVQAVKSALWAAYLKSTELWCRLGKATSRLIIPLHATNDHE